MEWVIFYDIVYSLRSYPAEAVCMEWVIFYDIVYKNQIISSMLL